MITLDHLPKWLFCIPFVMQWLCLSVRYGSLTLPSTINPCIENGGLAGESKLVYLRQVDRRYRDWIVPTIPVTAHDDADRLRRDNGVEFPLIAKPDIGWCGYGVRKIADVGDLARYAASFPPDATFLLQPFLAAPGEAALFYVREPGQAVGRVIAVTIRHRAFVTGDGMTSLGELIARDVSEEDRRRIDLTADERMRIPAAGETVPVTTVASLRFGGRYEDASRLITPELSAAVDGLCASMGDFHWGRLDAKFASHDDLRAGRFTVFEINGAGSEAIHCWDPHKSLREAIAGVFAKQRDLFALANHMRRAGHRPCGPLALARAWMKQQKLIAQYPPSN